MAWLYVPEAAGLNSDSILRCQNTAIAPFVLLSGKPTPLPASSDGWKKRPWARVLCGMTLPHSILARGVDSYISSLRVTLVNRGVAPEKSLERMIRAISGPTCTGLYAPLCRDTSSARTSQGILRKDIPKSGPNWSK